ncbi:MAG: M18 family aminopeptidase [Clostridia bacterium]|nr:M18 family aminopeptidase [Clostridia bacterium]
MEKLTAFLENAYTTYHACELIKTRLTENGFTQLKERADWTIREGGKYFVERAGGALIAFIVGGLDNFSYKIAAAHLDSPALKLKTEPIEKKQGVCTLNVEAYGGGIWYSFFDKPLKIAGRVVKNDNGRVYTQTVTSPFRLVVPSLAIHQNRAVNDGFAPNLQTDMQPLLSLADAQCEWLEEIVHGENVVGYDLFVVSDQAPFAFGANDEFLCSPRVDDLTSVCASLDALLACAESDGICVAAFFDAEEIGSRTLQGADGNFLGNTLRRIAYELRFDDQEYAKAISASFLLSVDNGHAVHPAHPEKADTTNKCLLGGGVIVKSHAGGAYTTSGVSGGVVKTVFDKAGVKRQDFYNRSDMRSGATIGAAIVTKTGMTGADIGIAQLAMHAACECFAKSDYEELVNGLTAFYSTNILAEDDGFVIQ